MKSPAFSNRDEPAARIRPAASLILILYAIFKIDSTALALDPIDEALEALLEA